MTTILLAGTIFSYLLVAILVFAARRPGYSHLHNTISELGAVDAADGRRVSFGVFLPVCLGLEVYQFLVERSGLAFADELSMVAGCVGFGYLVAAAFPCGPGGSSRSGSFRQYFHHLGQVVQYLGGGAALFGLAKVHDVRFQILSTIVVSASLLLFMIHLPKLRGLIQRVAETALWLGLLLPLW